jgi:3-phenylpropionate/trans-cinnamate dioxygenase ferredoxin reductase subunit
VSDTPAHLIIGAGLAGAKTTEALRAEGWDGRVLLFGSEPELPYDRPPLSKDYLRGESPREKMLVHPAGFYDAHDVELRTGTFVESIDTGAREVTVTGGERVAYERLLLATGAEPRQLSVPGADLDGVYYLRDFADADAIAERIGQGGHLTVIGAGWIGSEVAASARQRGLDVTVVEQSGLPLERVLGPELGEIYAQIHRDHGVELLTGAALAAFEGAGRVERVKLTDGRAFDTGFVVAGIGVTPRTDLAERAGLSLDNGVAVDERLETSAPGVFAAGDVANAFHPFYGRRLRVEHWANALNQPAVAARAMLGKPASYERLPYFYSDQYDLGMEYSGHAPSWDRVVFRGDPATREFIAFWVAQDRVVAGMNVGIWDVAEQLQALIRDPAVDIARLADPGVALADLLSRPAR